MVGLGGVGGLGDRRPAIAFRVVPTAPLRKDSLPLLRAQYKPSGEICHLEQHFITPPSRYSRKRVGGQRVVPARRTRMAWVLRRGGGTNATRRAARCRDRDWANG